MILFIKQQFPVFGKWP